jgi:hypothetical protein
MGSGLIEVQDIDLEKSREVLFVEDQEVIQAFSSHASQKAFTDGIGSWCSVFRHHHPGFLHFVTKQPLYEM